MGPDFHGAEHCRPAWFEICREARIQAMGSGVAKRHTIRQMLGAQKLLRPELNSTSYF